MNKNLKIDNNSMSPRQATRDFRFISLYMQVGYVQVGFCLRIFPVGIYLGGFFSQWAYGLFIKKIYFL